MKAVAFSFICVLLSCNLVAQHKILLEFKNYAGSQLLHAEHPYTNAAGEEFTVRNFRYYVGDIVVKNAMHREVHDAYFLIDEADSASKSILLDTKLASVSSIEFLLGVDSIKNVSGVQSGALDPAMGMFWTWNTGYVMAKLDGYSPAAKTPQHAFSYHVGGYKSGEQTARKITLNFIAADCTKDGAKIIIKADVLKWFDAVNKISIASTPLCHEPGSLAMMLADNYATMFSVTDK